VTKKEDSEGEGGMNWGGKINIVWIGMKEKKQRRSCAIYLIKQVVSLIAAVVSFFATALHAFN